MSQIKEIVLVIGNSSWWKGVKHRKESSIKLKKYKKLGWKLKVKRDVEKSENSIDTRKFQKYILYK